MEKIRKALRHVYAVIDLVSGCFTMEPDFDLNLCCWRHDMLYRIGHASRRLADYDLRRCIQRKGYRILPWIYWVAVRLFGWIAWRAHRRCERGALP